MTTDFNQIIFNQDHHSYTYQGQRLQGVTRAVSSLKPPFNQDSVAAKVAKDRTTPEKVWTPEMVKAEWDAKRKASMDRGSRVHEAIALHLKGDFAQVDDPYLAHNADLPEMRVFKALWVVMGQDNLVHNTEWVIGDSELGIAGTCDAVMLNRPANTYHLFDWKTGSKFETANRFQKLLPPFDDLDDCEFNIYSIQLAAYRLIIERNTGKQLGDSYIVHLREDGHQFHKALDLRERVEGWLRAREL
jgi:hypothetical protein